MSGDDWIINPLPSDGVGERIGLPYKCQAETLAPLPVSFHPVAPALE